MTAPKYKVILMTSDMLESPAFQSLSLWALRVYLRFLTKRHMVRLKSNKKDRSENWDIANNGEIVFCYSEAKEMKIREREFRNSLDELIDKGFLDINHQGTGGRKGDVSTYSLGHRWIKWNTPEYQPTPNPRKKDTRQGRGWAAWNARKKQSSMTILPANPPLSNGETVNRKGKKAVFRLTVSPFEKTREIEVSC